MRVPQGPIVRPLDTISPTLYDSALLCKARAAWQAFGQRDTLPSHPAALLGQAYHAVMEAAILGRLGATGEEVEERGRALFESRTERLFKSSHPLLRAKFGRWDRLPYYSLYMERAAQKAASLRRADPAKRRLEPESSDQPSATRRLTEKELFSSDRRIKGRPDYVDLDQGAVIDYKSGAALQIANDEMTDSERRQLTLYAFLLRENEVAVTRGIIDRADGRRAEVAISVEAAEREAANARTVQDEFNNAAAILDFQGLANASPISCASCPCIPLCEQFWNNANKDWSSSVGVHVGGRVEHISTVEVSGVQVASISVGVDSGTVQSGPSTVEQIPTQWLTCDSSDLPSAGDYVRVVDAKISSDDPLVIVTDKAMTSVWTQPRAERPQDA
jgi:CRISPR/Cas system-associated exonuclease Cas4 (RecB family)